MIGRELARDRSFPICIGIVFLRFGLDCVRPHATALPTVTMPLVGRNGVAVGGVVGIAMAARPSTGKAFRAIWLTVAGDLLIEFVQASHAIDTSPGRAGSAAVLISGALVQFVFALLPPPPTAS